AADDHDESIADWFDTSSDPKVAEAVAAAEAVARQEVPGPLTPTRVPQPIRRPVNGPSPAETTGQLPAIGSTAPPSSVEPHNGSTELSDQPPADS
ncbi:MAG TPA: SPFH/Band 7/PHB domain protein, partial [Pseudonocardiaceae bacterium]|nr:SPFH/Band 7/PHB domain protein [Pseudonocardiaceae bacterium]